jgi:hypothetical protein
MANSCIADKSLPPTQTICSSFLNFRAAGRVTPQIPLEGKFRGTMYDGVSGALDHSEAIVEFPVHELAQ